MIPKLSRLGPLAQVAETATLAGSMQDCPDLGGMAVQRKFTHTHTLKSSNPGPWTQNGVVHSLVAESRIDCLLCSAKLLPTQHQHMAHMASARIVGSVREGDLAGSASRTSDEAEIREIMESDEGVELKHSLFT
eukprot:1354278-Amphidinium_carterae.1